MANRLPMFGKVAREKMEHLFSPEVLLPRVPGMEDTLGGAAFYRSMHEEIGVLGKMHKALGFTQDRSFQITSHIDTTILVLLEETHKELCSCGRGLMGVDGHKAWYFEWLNGPGRNFDARGKVTL